MPKNYADIKAALVKHLQPLNASFDSIAGDDTVAQQIRRFYHADVVVGPHGANLANMMFMRKGAHVLEMASRSKGNMCYYTTACRIGLVHHLLLHSKGKDEAYTLEAADVIAHVDIALKSLGFHV